MYLSAPEGITQGDPLSMPWFSLNTVHVIQSLRNQVPSVKQVWLADDASGGGKLWDLHEWYNLIVSQGKKSDYYVYEKKCWLILKGPSRKEEARKIFAGTAVNITAEEQRHLGAVVGSKDSKNQYCSSEVTKWTDEINRGGGGGGTYIVK